MKHEHLLDHEAHVHGHAWIGRSKNKTAYYAMVAGNVPVTKVVRTTVEVPL